MSISGQNGIAGLWPALDRALTQGAAGQMVLREKQQEQKTADTSRAAIGALTNAMNIGALGPRPGMAATTGNLPYTQNPLVAPADLPKLPSALPQMPQLARDKLAALAFPEQNNARLAQQFYPSPDAIEKVDAGGSIVSVNKGTGKARSIFTAPLKPTDMKGDWVVDLNTGKPVMKTDADVMNSNGNYAPLPKGMRIASDGQGGFEITTDGMQPTGNFTKPTETALESTIISGGDALARLDTIGKKYKPEYLQLAPRWANLWASAKDKAGIPLSPEDSAQLSDFASFRRDTVENTNKTIQDITGATVGADEAPRLMQQMPVAGQGLFDGDGPVEFMAKFKATQESIKSAVARAAYAKANNLSKKAQFAIPLGSVPKIIEDKGNQYAKELKDKNPNIPEEQLNQMVKNRLMNEFGMNR